MPSNVENILNAILTGDGSGIQKPASRVEELLFEIYEQGGGGGGDSVIGGIKLTIDENYVMTATLVDKDGEEYGVSDDIDLPLEEMVVDAEYDPQTQKIKLELKNGNYVEFSVAELVSGLQTELSSDNKLNPTYIAYDASHRAVSDTEKDTWNAKQNAISDLETIRSGAAAGATAVQPSTMETALAAKQNSLSETQLAAVNSGINSTKVGQIETNAENVLYALNNGVHNWFDVAAEGNSQYGLSDYSADTETGTVNVASTTSSGSWARYRVPVTLPAGTYTISGNVTAIVGDLDITGNTNLDDQGTVIISRIRRNSTGNFSSDFTINSETSFYVAFYANYSGTAQNRSATVTHMMIAPKEVWDTVGHDFQPPSLPNYELTRLEAEDRASLAEVVDSGAKNIIPVTRDEIKSYNAWGWNGYTATNGGITYTLNADGSITMNGTSTATGELSILPRTAGRSIFPKAGTYVLYAQVPKSLNPSGAENVFIGVNRTVSGSGVRYGVDKGDGATFTVQSSELNNANGIWIGFSSAGLTVNNVTFYPMICTLADWKISQKFVPYRPNWDLVGNTVNYVDNTFKRLDYGSNNVTTISVNVSTWQEGTYLVACNNATSNTSIKGTSVYMFTLRHSLDFLLFTKIAEMPTSESSNSNITNMTISNDTITISYAHAGYHSVYAVKL